MKLSNISFFCPALNEEDNLPLLIESVRGALSEFADVFEIIIIDDGSTDRSAAIADGLAAEDLRIRVIHHSMNLGYGISLREGFKTARYEWIMYTDSDYQYNIREVIPYLTLLQDYDIISGYVTRKAMSTRRRMQSKIYNGLVRLLFGIKLNDINCAMKIYSRKVIDIIDIRSKGFFVDAEMLIRARRKGFRIAQFPVTHLPRSSGAATGARAGLVLETMREMALFRLGLL